eukprot:scaffold31273_cov38-Phaeocystis_antarctica.AAC.1
MRRRSAAGYGGGLSSLPRRSEVVGRARGSGDRVRALLGEAGGGAPLTVSQCRSGCPRHQRRSSLLVTPSALTFMLRSRWGGRLEASREVGADRS